MQSTTVSPSFVTAYSAVQARCLCGKNAITGSVKQSELIGFSSHARACVYGLQEIVGFLLFNCEDNFGAVFIESLPNLRCGHVRPVS